MPGTIGVPFVEALVPGGIEYGTNVLVEFGPDSLWQETTVTLTAQALRHAAKAEYHTFMRYPEKIRDSLSRLGLELEKFEKGNSFRIIDSYSTQTGLSSGKPEASSNLSWATSQSLKLSDWSIDMAQILKAGVEEEDKRWLHIDDNTSVLLQYNEEKALIDYFRTRIIPTTYARETVAVNSFLEGSGSPSFIKQLENLYDVILDFRSEEKEGALHHYARARVVRGRAHDSRWHELAVGDDGEVQFKG